MEMTDKWAYALGDEEDYNGVFFDSKEAALEEAMDDARQHGYSTVRLAGLCDERRPGRTE